MASKTHAPCDTCGRILRIEDGPTCEDCKALARSEAARHAAEARWDGERERAEEQSEA